MGVVFTDVNLAGAILAAEIYLLKNTVFEKGFCCTPGSRYDLLRSHVVFLADSCSDILSIDEQVKVVMKLAVNLGATIYLEKIA